MSVCLVVNLSDPLPRMDNRAGAFLPNGLQPSFVHDDIEGARAEAVRLHQQKRKGRRARFVIFQAVEFTETRPLFDKSGAVIVMQSFGADVPLPLPEKALRQKRRGKKKGGGA